MSNNNRRSKTVSVDKEAFENNEDAAIDENGFEVVDDRTGFRPTVEMEVQVKVDANHPDARVDDGPDHMGGKTLAQEERIQARNDELEHISTQAELTTQEGRPGRTRDVVTEQSANQHEKFQERRAAVKHWADPERDDPQEMLTQAQLGEVNSEVMRMDEKLDQWSRAAISRRLAEAVVDGTSVMSAVLRVCSRRCRRRPDGYQERLSVALRGWSTVYFPERGRWWDE